MGADSRWHANVHRFERRQVGLVRPGDGRDPNTDPWADPGTIHIIGPAEARALAAELIAAADEIEREPVTLCPCGKPATCRDSMDTPLCDACFDALPEVSDV